jgi:SSS family solute:Na+ symporter
MSTYAATVNAAPAYVVNDIYKRYINPDADDKTYVRMSYLTSVVVVIAGTAFGFVIDDLKDVVNWIVGALYGGYVAANLLKWHWWRFNGWGYFWGMTGGIGSAMAIATVVKTYPQIGGFETNLALFPVTLVISLVGCIAGSLLTAPDDPEVLQHFYLKVRPWGWWGPVREQLLATHPDLAANKDFSRDAVNVAVGIAWQTALTAAGIYLVLQNWTALGWCVAVIVVTSVILKFNWYDKLQDYPDGYQPDLAVET